MCCVKVKALKLFILNNADQTASHRQHRTIHISCLCGMALMIFAGHYAKELRAMLDKLALILSIIGAVNWGLVGIFRFDFVGWLFGGQTAVISRIIFTLVGLAGLWCVSLLFRERNELAEHSNR